METKPRSPFRTTITLSTGKQIGSHQPTSMCKADWQIAGMHNDMVPISIDDNIHYFNPQHIVSIEPYKASVDLTYKASVDLKDMPHIEQTNPNTPHNQPTPIYPRLPTMRYI